MSNGTFDSKQIVARALRGLEIPRPATGPLAAHYHAQYGGASLREYSTDPKVLADCVVQYYERFRPDAVWVSADTWVSAQAMGARVICPGENQPLSGAGEPPIQTAADVERIPPPEPNSQGRWPLMLEALQRVNERIGQDVFIVACFDQYPFSLACALMGIQPLMMKLMDDRSMVETLMEKCLEYTVAYASALGQVGADMLSGGDSPAGMIGPDLYREVALPFERRTISQLRSSFGNPLSLHICGDATPILPDMVASGADVLELDYQVNLAEACRTVGPDVAIWGNLNPVAVLAQGSSQQVRQAARDLLQTIDRCGHRRFVLSPGCTMALETPAENVEAMIEVARNWKMSV